MSSDQYIKICEELGQEPDPEKMPLELSDFPEEVQVAFFMLSLLSDRWDGASGSYLGKDWGPIEYIFRLYEIEDKKTLFHFMKLIESYTMMEKAKQVERERKAQERRSKTAARPAGGKKYTHNVKG